MQGNTPSSPDDTLLYLMERSLYETFSGNHDEFEEALAEAMATQIVELSAENNGFSLNLKDELLDAMRAVLLQWIGEHPPLPREDLPILFARLGITTSEEIL
jgi:hypothetical protein